ncbi:MAG: hypothetical protein JW751_09780 [Polyangiaceae bacterium]|nr:hypothetical protein [Polyangiaceae bacterium]
MNRKPLFSLLSGTIVALTLLVNCKDDGDEPEPTVVVGTGGHAGEPASASGGNGGDPVTGTGGVAGEPTTRTGGSAGEPSTATGGSAGEPTTRTGGSAGEPTTATGGSAGEPTTTTGGSAGDGTGGGPVDCEDAENECFRNVPECVPDEPEEFMNRCTDSTCIPYDNSTLSRLVDGEVPELP